jgi:DNA topoisomerase-1
MNVVIVESAAKAKTINKYLGRDYKVMASFGHVRDLPSKDGSVEPDNDFAMHWEADTRAKKILSDITKAVKGSEKLILATDPDREGEAISWHLLQVLEKRRALKGVEVERVAFNAVTKNAIRQAMDDPRTLDQPLIDAYMARRALDYLVGFTLSPVLWRKLPGSRSAGRVQSVALRLICDRELEIETFTSREYWDIVATLLTEEKHSLDARLVSVGGGKLGKYDIPDEKTACDIKANLKKSDFTVENVESKPHNRHPAPPFTTSTMQQEASRKLGFNSRQTMQVAQKLYEGINLGGETVGLITYMRTDGVQIVSEAVTACRGVIDGKFGKNYLPKSPRAYKTKAKNAQEAHEAIRPTDFRRHPDDVKKFLSTDETRLYQLIWRRAVASQMSSAAFERTTVNVTASNKSEYYGLRATGQVQKFDGFLKLYQEGLDDVKIGDDGEANLPPVHKGERLNEKEIKANQHFTEPPPRYTEATLIKKMEEIGIGRPSTYTATLNVLRDREYVRIEQKRLIPEDKGRLVTAFLESFFQQYVEYDFTAELEEKLDTISDGKLSWKDVLNEFWRDFTAAVDETKELRVSEVLDNLNEILGPYVFPKKEDGSDPRKCPECDDGIISLKVGRFGAFIGCSNYPDCSYTRQFSNLSNGEEKSPKDDNRALGIDPDSGLEVTVRSGRFGPYIQLGEATKKGDKPKRASIPKGQDPGNVDLERALALLSLPRDIGKHPESGKMISAGIGRYGPFVLHDGVYANLDSVEEVFSVGINRAVAVLAEKAAAKGSRGGRQAIIKDLGGHPEGGGKVQVMDGRYGPYVKYGRTNATLPDGVDPQEVTMELATELIAKKSKAKTRKKPGKKAPPKNKS